MGLSVDTQIELFEKTVLPIALYGCEIWGSQSNLEVVEIFYRSYIKQVLKLNKGGGMGVIRDWDLGHLLSWDWEIGFYFSGNWDIESFLGLGFQPFSFLGLGICPFNSLGFWELVVFGTGIWPL